MPLHSAAFNWPDAYWIVIPRAVKKVEFRPLIRPRGSAIVRRLILEI